MPGTESKTSAWETVESTEPGSTSDDDSHYSSSDNEHGTRHSAVIYYVAVATVAIATAVAIKRTQRHA